MKAKARKQMRTMDRCATCEGSGRVTHRFDGRSPMASSPVECPCCLGTGSSKVCELIEQAAEGERALGSLKIRLGQVEAENTALRVEVEELKQTRATLMGEAVKVGVQLAELREAAESARAFVTWISAQWGDPVHIKEFAHNNAERLRTALAKGEE